MKASTRSWLRAYLVAMPLAVVMLCQTSIAASRPARPGCGKASPAPVGRWKQIAMPVFEDGDMARYVALDPSSDRNLFVGSKRSIKASSDGGCTWRDLFTIGPDTMQEVALTGTARIAQLQAVAGDGNVSLFALIRNARPAPPGQDPGEDAPDRSYLASSKDGGRSWSLDPITVPGSPPVDDEVTVPKRLWVAPSDPSIIYASAVNWAPYNEPKDFLYGSNDGGKTWDLRSVYVDGKLRTENQSAEAWCAQEEGTTACTGAPFYFMRVDPHEPEVLWTVGHSGLFRSSTGGKRWDRIVQEVPPAPTAFGLDRRPGEGSRLAIAGYNEIAKSFDEGESWSVTEPPGSPRYSFNTMEWIDGESLIASTAVGYSEGGCTTVSDAETAPQVVVIDPKLGWVDVTPGQVVGDQWCGVAATSERSGRTYVLVRHKTEVGYDSALFIYKR